MVKGSPISTYQKNYKSRYPAFTPVYEKNVDYRVDRRRLEHNHATGPFTWDDEWETSSEELNGHNGQISKRPHSLPPHKYKHDKFNKAYQEKMNNQTFVFQNRNGISVFAPAKNTLSKTKEVKVKARCYKDDFAQTVSMEDVAVQTEMNDRRKERTNKATAEETLERAPTAGKTNTVIFYVAMVTLVYVLKICSMHTSTKNTVCKWIMRCYKTKKREILLLNWFKFFCQLNNMPLINTMLLNLSLFV